MEKVIIHAAYPLWRKCSLVGFARARELQDEGHEVTLTYCAAKCGSCISNQTGNPLVCTICRTTTRLTAKKLGLNAVPLNPERKPDGPAGQTAQVATMSERKEIVEGVLSGLISVFRILPHDIQRNRILRLLKRRAYRTSLGLLLHFKSLMSSRPVDRFEVFNGRHACSKAGILAARAQALPFNTMEVTASRQPIIHRGYTAHDRDGVQRRIKSQPLDWELAETFYANRRKPRSNKFAKHHSQSFQLPSVDGFERMVSIFLSSQDEFASLGKTWKTSFDKDHAVIGRLCERFPKTLFCIRFHPNQGGIKSDITSEFAKLESLGNTKIYYPTDSANTYQLVDASHTVVVFNSTVAAEANWVGKPVIMIGPSFYDQLDIGYTPANEQALWDLMASPSLAPKDRENAVRLAHYFLKDGDEMKYIRVEKSHMTADGAQRRLPLLSVLGRQCNTIASETLKRFV